MSEWVGGWLGAQLVSWSRMGQQSVEWVIVWLAGWLVGWLVGGMGGWMDGGS